MIDFFRYSLFKYPFLDYEVDHDQTNISLAAAATAACSCRLASIRSAASTAPGTGSGQ
jgi:hypothetical protein